MEEESLRISSATLIVFQAAFLSVLVAAMLAGCPSTRPVGALASPGASASKSQLVVETEDYTFIHPKEWAN